MAIQTVLFKGCRELTMKEYEALDTLETEKDYNITDYPINSITNSQMEYALTCNRLFVEGETFTCLDDGTYQIGHTYMIVNTAGVKSWKDITPQEDNNVVTIDEAALGRPVNFATEMEKGKIYLLNNCNETTIRGTWKGLNVRLRSTGNTYQILKYSSSQLIFENCNLITSILNFGSGPEKCYSFNASYYSYARVTIDTTTGLITNIEPVLLLKGVNGDNLATGASNIYAPHTSGTAGQVLSSNGENQEPTWVNLNDIGFWSTFPGFDATKRQVFKNINGTLQWVDEV